MNSINSAEQSLREGDVATALQRLQEQVRAQPADSRLRIFLFQLLAVTGQWERALAQLDVAAELDAGALAMVQMYRQAIHCEALRAQVFAGAKSPMVFGEPEQWLALLIESLLLRGRGQKKQADRLHAEAFELAPESAGAIDGTPFVWIADADCRLGPVLEAIINGRYYWAPFNRLSAIFIDEPADLRDVVWMPAHLKFDNGGEAVALIPSRYPGSETSSDAQILLARKTVWEETGPNLFCGLGQRMLATDHDEVPLMDARKIILTGGAESAQAANQD